MPVRSSCDVSQQHVKPFTTVARLSFESDRLTGRTPGRSSKIGFEEEAMRVAAQAELAEAMMIDIGL